jgi:hypothetical protein
MATAQLFAARPKPQLQPSDPAALAALELPAGMLQWAYINSLALCTRGLQQISPGDTVAIKIPAGRLD